MMISLIYRKSISIQRVSKSIMLRILIFKSWKKEAKRISKANANELLTTMIWERETK